MVCRYHSITRAADALYVSQPTISTSIRDLEKEFHLKLFNHGKNRISLTKDGAAFYQKAEFILKQTQELYTDFSNIEKKRHPLRIGIPPMISTVFFPRVTDQFQEQYNIPIQLLEYGSLRARTLVDNEQLDIAMANMDFYNLDKYNSYVMMEDRYVYCVSKTHRYAGEKEITMDMLKDEPIILFNTDSVQTQTVITRLRSAGITPNVHMYCSQLVTVLNFVRGGKCGAFLIAHKDGACCIVGSIEGVIYSGRCGGQSRVQCCAPSSSSTQPTPTTKKSYTAKEYKLGTNKKM
jgi:DNA-binding transcriptional LysR family regulator